MNPGILSETTTPRFGRTTCLQVYLNMELEAKRFSYVHKYLQNALFYLSISQKDIALPEIP